MGNYSIARVAPVEFAPAKVAAYLREPQLVHRPYAEQHAAVLRESAVYSDGFSRGMGALGNRAWELLYDHEILQKTWAREHGLRFGAFSWRQEILLAQLRHFQPDVVYFQDIHSLPHEVRRQLKQIVPGVRLTVVHKGFPGAARELGDVDLLLAGIPAMVRQYRQAGLEAQLMYHAFDPAVLERLERGAGADGPSAKHEFVFSGASGFGDRLTKRSRYELLLGLLQLTPLEAWVEERFDRPAEGDGTLTTRAKLTLWKGLRGMLMPLAPATLQRLAQGRRVPAKLKTMAQQAIELKTRAAEVPDPRWPGQPLRELAPQRCHPAVFGLEMYRLLQSSRVVLNRHTDEAGGCVGNMRMFEATGVGTCLLTDSGENLADLFEADHEVVTYSSLEECVEKVEYLLGDPRARAEIAAAGHQRTLRDHTLVKRCAQVDELIRQRL